mmetsp:Transcript_34657/g.136588  ORF Transcript_34657/g.136588 Transcript_34657/m.136588 type:complete len:127 (-) Transcript_34657:3409-3789(-)
MAGDAVWINQCTSCICPIVEQQILRRVNCVRLCFLCDIVIYSANADDHKRHLDIVFSKLRDNKLYKKRAKCVFGVPQAKYLGHLVGSGTWRPVSTKVDAIKKWRTPTTSEIYVPSWASQTTCALTS